MSRLNPSQEAAVFAPTGAPLIIVAPPGSGKTHCLVERIRRLLGEEGCGEVLALTFTNKAAGEMRARVEGLGEGGGGSSLWATTFHSFCLRLCRQQRWIAPRASIWAASEQSKALKALITARLLRNDSQADVSAAVTRPLVAQFSSLLGRPPSDFAVGSEEREMLQSYQRMKEQQNAIDFDDMLLIVLDRLSKMPVESFNPLSRFRAVLVDEWQDTSHVQLKLVELIARHTRSITVVGDPHQSIYAFRGAEFSNWQKLKRLLDPLVIYLSTNYRSTAIVSSVCQGLIAYNPAPKLLDQGEAPQVETVRPERDAMHIVQCRDNDGEAEYVAESVRRLHDEEHVPWSEICVLFRSNPRQRTSRVLELALIRQKVPYTVVAGQALYETKCVKLAISWLRFLLNERDEMAWDVICKGNKLTGKAFEMAWKGYRRHAESSFSALERFLGAGAAPQSISASFAETLIRLGEQLRSWRQQLSSADVSLRAFIEGYIMRQVHFPSDAESTERMRFLLDQIPEKPTTEPVTHWALEDQIMAFLEKIALYSPSEDAGGVAGSEEGRCVLSTIHQSKGLEWTAVFVVQCLEGVLPSRQSLKRDEEMNQEVDEERRLMFVAMSRAKRFLYLTYPKPGRRYEAVAVL